VLPDHAGAAKDADLNFPLHALPRPSVLRGGREK